jgi:cell volume regulation protein A
MQSIHTINLVLLAGSALIVAGILSSLVAQRFGAPLLLVFLGIGMLIGEDGPGGVAFGDYSTAYMIGSVALAVILFDGGLRTRLSSFQGVFAPSVLLASGGVLATALAVSLLAMPLLGLSFAGAFLVGAILAPTDAAAVFLLLRAGGLQLYRRVGSTLEIESGTNDPVAVLLTVVLVEYMTGPGSMPGFELFGMLVKHGFLGALIGTGGGLVLVLLLNRVDLPAGLHPLLAVGCALAIFALTQVLDGSGFLAVYLAGLVVGNSRVRAFASITAFHDAATWLVQIVMFVVLGLLVTPSDLLHAAVPGLIIAFFLMFVARPLSVFLCLAPFGYSLSERLFVSWVGLRGAVSIFLAAIPTLAALPDGSVYFNVAFIAVVTSLIVQGWTLTPLARRLELALPNTRPVVTRVEIDLPGQQEHEMVGYHIDPGSAVLNPGASPRWARPVFVVRDDRILEPTIAGALRPGDYAYFLAPPERVRELDRIFAAEEAEFDIGTYFPLRGGVQLQALSALYDLHVGKELGERTVAEHFAIEMEGEPAPGNRISLGPAMLVVRTVTEGRVTEANLVIGGMADDEPPVSEGTLRTAILARARQQIMGLGRVLNRQ